MLLGTFLSHLFHWQHTRRHHILSAYLDLTRLNKLFSKNNLLFYQIFLSFTCLSPSSIHLFVCTILQEHQSYLYLFYWIIWYYLFTETWSNEEWLQHDHKFLPIHKHNQGMWENIVQDNTKYYWFKATDRSTILRFLWFKLIFPYYRKKNIEFIEQ